MYRSDPIQEALCELRFRKPTSGWALLPGLLYERLRDDYPAEPIQDSSGFNIGPIPGGPNVAQVQFMMGQGVPGRIRLCSEDNSEQLLIAGNSITVSCLRPYKGWTRFRERIVRVVQNLDEVFEDGFDLERIGVRYINKVTSALDEVDKYFGVKPVQYSEVPLKLANFICRSELPLIEDENTLIVATFASVMGEQAIALDLDVISQNLTGVDSVSQCMDLVDRLRQLEREAFEMSITDEAREGPFGGFDVSASG